MRVKYKTKNKIFPKSLFFLTTNELEECFCFSNTVIQMQAAVSHLYCRCILQLRYVVCVHAESHERSDQVSGFSSLEASQCPNFSSDFIILSQHYHYWSVFGDSVSAQVTVTLPAEKAHRRALLVNNWLFEIQLLVRTFLTFF